MASSATRTWSKVANGSTRLPERDLAGALADRLAREFDAPVGLLDPVGRIWVVRVGIRADEFPDAESCACTVLGLGGAQEVILWRSARGPVWLGLPVGPSGPGELVALVGFATDAGPSTPGPWGPPCPEPALRAWGAAVAERLRADAGSGISSVKRSGVPTELTDGLVRRLRVSDPPERFQRLAARALHEALAASAVAWVPASPREPVVVEGHEDGYPAESFRTLVPESSAEVVRLHDETTTEGRRVAVVAADTTSPSGWLAIVRRADAPPFDGTEIELIRACGVILSAQRANARLYGDLKDLLFGIIRALTSAIDAKDPYTSGHSERVARIAVRLGEALGLSPNQRGDLYLMGLLHDVGKIGIEDEVLKKASKLTPEEYRQIQAHVKIGVHILADLKKLHHLLPGVAHHHENLDGSGYPAGLVGEAIPLAARILAVADAYDAMSSNRPYRRRLSAEAIDTIFRQGAGTQWDPRIVEALFICRGDIERIRSKGIGESLRRVVGDTLGRDSTL